MPARFHGLCLLILWWLTLSIRLAFAQSGEGHARSEALAHATTTLTEAFANPTNPASLASVDRVGFSSYASNPYLLPDFTLGALYLAIPTTIGVFGGSLQTAGNGAYRVSEFSLDWGFKINTRKGLSHQIGLRVKRVHLTLQRYGHTQTLALTGGWITQLLSVLQVGTRINYQWPFIDREVAIMDWAVGLGYQPAESVLLLVEGYKETSFTWSIRIGIELRTTSYLALRTGITSNPTRFSSGIGVLLGRLQVDLSGQKHEVLGWSPSCSIAYIWK